MDSRYSQRSSSRSSRGLCNDCPLPRRPGMTTCQGCADKRAARRRVLCESRRERGLCQYCPEEGVRAAIPGRYGCAQCLKRLAGKTQDVYRAVWKAGTCITCPNAPLKGQLRCAACAATNRVNCSAWSKDHSHERWLKLKAATVLTGKCQTCAEHNPVSPGSFRCEKCCKRRRALDRVRPRARAHD